MTTKAQAAHTAGPWRVEPDTAPNGTTRIVGPHGQELAELYTNDGADDPEWFPVEANAALIAAAPDLLAALRDTTAACAAAMRVINRLDVKTDGTDATDAFLAEVFTAGVRDGFGVRAIQALAKAEGT